ncbi:hypothetical protein Tco_1479012 [Tanacetum coccineum]
MSKHKGTYVTPSNSKKIFANIKREVKGFSRRITPLFQTMMVQAPEYMGENLAAPTDSHSTPIITQTSSSKPQKKKSKRKQRKDSGPTEPIPDEATNEEPISTPSCDPPQSSDDRLQLTELINLCEEVVAEQKVAKKEVNAADPVTTAGEVVTIASATTTVDELTLARTLIEIKVAKPNAVTTSATTITTAVASTRPKAKGMSFMIRRSKHLHLHQ